MVSWLPFGKIPGENGRPTRTRISTADGIHPPISEKQQRGDSTGIRPGYRADCARLRWDPAIFGKRDERYLLKRFGLCWRFPT